MNTMAVKKSSIIQDLSRVPESNLAALEQYLDGLLRSEQVMRKNEDSLRGIWKGKGFERITHSVFKISDCEFEP